MELVLFKRIEARLPEEGRRAVHQFLFNSLGGVTEKDHKAWLSFWRGVAAAPAGEYFSITIRRQRNSRFHRLAMAVLAAVFKGQERFDDFRIFRAFVALGAGHVDYVPNADGELRAVPKSVSFSECSEDEMRLYFEAATAFLRTRRAQATLWPDASPQAAEAGLMTLLRKFDKQP